MLTDFVSVFLARRALSKQEQKQNNVPLFWDKAQRAKKVVNISLPILLDRKIANTCTAYQHGRSNYDISFLSISI